MIKAHKHVPGHLISWSNLRPISQMSGYICLKTSAYGGFSAWWYNKDAPMLRNTNTLSSNHWKHVVRIKCFGRISILPVLVQNELVVKAGEFWWYTDPQVMNKKNTQRYQNNKINRMGLAKLHFVYMLTCYESMNLYDICMYVYENNMYTFRFTWSMNEITAAYYKQINFHGPGWTINSFGSPDFPEISGSKCRRWFQYSCFFWHTPQPVPTKYKKGIPSIFGRMALGMLLGCVVIFLLKRGVQALFTNLRGEFKTQHNTNWRIHFQPLDLCDLKHPTDCTLAMHRTNPTATKSSKFQGPATGDGNNDGWWVTKL